MNGSKVTPKTMCLIDEKKLAREAEASKAAVLSSGTTQASPGVISQAVPNGLPAQGLKEMVRCIDKETTPYAAHAEYMKARQTPEAAESGITCYEASMATELPPAQGRKEMVRCIDKGNTPYVVPEKRMRQRQNPQAATSVTNVYPVFRTAPDTSNTLTLPPEYPRQVGDCIVQEDGCVLFDTGAWMNAAVRVKGADNIKGKVHYTCEVFVKGKSTEVPLSADKYFDGGWVRSVSGVTTIGKKSEIGQGLFNYLSGLVAMFDISKVVNHVEKPGWQDVDGKLAYVTPEGVIGSNSRTIADYGQRFGELDKQRIGHLGSFLDMLKLTPNTVAAAIIVLYIVLSFSYKLFMRAGMVPKFILFLLGPSGSRKTSLALAMTQLENTDRPQYTMKSTAAALESGFKTYKDAIMLIDDLAPDMQVSERNAMQRNLELLTRCFGDGTGKKRNHDYLKAGKEISQYEAEGGAIITGEYSTGCASSLARNLFLNLDKNDVDINLLTDVQNNPRLAPFLYGFLQYLTVNSTRIIDLIRNRTQQHRREAQGQYSHSRYAEYRAQLLTAAELLVRYGQETQQLTTVEAESLWAYFCQQIGAVIADNDQKSIEATPITVLCNALVVGSEQRFFPVVPFGEPVAKGSHVILEDEEAYYIQQSDILKIVDHYTEVNGINKLGLSVNGLGELLADARIIEKQKEGSKVRCAGKYPHYGNTRYSKIDKVKLFETAQV